MSVVLTAGVIMGVTVPVAQARPAAGDLQADLDGILSDSRLKGAGVGVVVRDAKTGAIQYTRGADSPLIPAGNQKIYTSTAALDILGAGYRFRTSVHAQKVTGRTVTGNLYLKGTGDPTMRLFEYDRLASAVARAGITRVTGNLVADDTWFDAMRTPSHWDPADLQYSYAAQTSALTFAPDDDYNAGSIKISVTPGANGKPVIVTPTPPTDVVKIDNRARTGPAGSPSSLSIQRPGRGNTIVVSGTYPVSGKPVEVLRSVTEPTLYAADIFRKVLATHGVDVDGTTMRGATPAGARRLAVHRSMSLARMTTPFLKLGNNMIAEALVKAIGRKTAGQGTWAAGLPAIQRYVQAQGVSADHLTVADGSGMSRRNRATAQDVSTVLQKARTKPWFHAWYRALPVAGDPNRLIGGTLTDRLRNTPVVGIAHAQTGTMTGVSALSGYVRAPKGRSLIFSIVFNGYTGQSVKDIEDKIVIRLAGATDKSDA